MKGRRLISNIGIVSILLLLLLTSCETDILKSSQNQPQDGLISEEESSAESSATGSNVDPVVDESTTKPTENPETNCSTLNPHPMAEGMAEQFEVSYDEIMTWYCDGYAFSDILLALETEELVDQSAEELLSMIENSTWDEIWQNLGVKPK